MARITKQGGTIHTITIVTDMVSKIENSCYES